MSIAILWMIDTVFKIAINTVTDMNFIHLLTQPQQSRHFNPLPHTESSLREDEYFNHEVEKKFLKEIHKHMAMNRTEIVTAGMGKRTDFRLVAVVTEWDNYSIESVCLFDPGNRDSNDSLHKKTNMGNYKSVYHVLPDGRMIEFCLNKSYEDSINYIYSVCSRCYLEENLTKHPGNESKRPKI